LGLLLNRLDQTDNLNVRALAKILQDGVEQID
jgi:hypothetical protein